MPPKLPPWSDWITLAEAVELHKYAEAGTAKLREESGSLVRIQGAVKVKAEKIIEGKTEPFATLKTEYRPTTGLIIPVVLGGPETIVRLVIRANGEMQIEEKLESLNEIYIQAAFIQ